jgi:hypothetical protein
VIADGDGRLDGDDKPVLSGIHDLRLTEERLGAEPSVALQDLERVANVLGTLPQQINVDTHEGILLRLS